MDFTNIIESEFSKWRRSNEEINDPQDINNRYCRQFANGVVDTVREHFDPDSSVHVREYGYDSSGYTSGAHVWIEYDGLHYDAECPEGVSDPSDLPLFKRMGINPAA